MMSKNQNLPSKLFSGLNSRELVREIFKSESPERVIRTLPAQSLYMAIKVHGLAAHPELFELASLDQCRAILDFDLWERDKLRDDGFWEWLALPDSTENLESLRRFISTVDLKLVGLIISRLVNVISYEEATDDPPDNGYYTPDRGRTWLQIKVEDTQKHFLMSRFLAFIFDRESDLFYQLLSVPAVSTEAVLEEEAFQDRERRLAGEGFPARESAARLNSPLTVNLALAELNKGPNDHHSYTRIIVEPLLCEGGRLEPLATLEMAIKDHERFEGELTLLMNAALIYWNVEIYESEAVAILAAKVKGAINIGLEAVLSATERSIEEIYGALHLEGLYRVGLAHLFSLRSKGRKFTQEELQLLATDQPKFALLAGAREPFPEVAAFFDDELAFMTQPEPVLAKGYRALENLKELKALERLVEGLKGSGVASLH